MVFIDSTDDRQDVQS